VIFRYLLRFTERRIIMKIFLDTADRGAIQNWVSTGLIDGVTTNPTLLSKEGGDPKKVIQDICELLSDGDVSVEVTQIEPDAVYKQAKEIASIAENVVVKIPCHPNYYRVIKKLVEEDIAINATLIFTLIQGLVMCKLGVTYISPFVGRLDDIDVEGIDLLYELREMMDHYNFVATELLAASIRDVRHFHKAISAQADIATIPVDVFEKSMHNPLTEQGMEKFLIDWKKLGITQFP
jgi:transaldolase